MCLTLDGVSKVTERHRLKTFTCCHWPSLQQLLKPSYKLSITISSVQWVNQCAVVSVTAFYRCTPGRFVSAAWNTHFSRRLHGKMILSNRWQQLQNIDINVFFSQTQWQYEKTIKWIHPLSSIYHNHWRNKYSNLICITFTIKNLCVTLFCC